MVVSLTTVTQLNTPWLLWNPLPFSIDSGMNSIVTGLLIWPNEVWFLAWTGDFLLSYKTSRLALGSTQLPIQWILGFPSLGVKQLGHEADHLPPPTAEVKNEWSYISTCLAAWTGITLPLSLLRNDVCLPFILCQMNLCSCNDSAEHPQN
jgi:hypothetical protein